MSCVWEKKDLWTPEKANGSAGSSEEVKKLKQESY